MGESESYYPEDRHPSVVPDNEVEVPDETAFIALCMADMAEHAERVGWRFGESLLTRHPEFGLVWRVDIKTRDETSQSPCRSRYIFWRPPDMTGGIGGTLFTGIKEEDRLR
jgi:hypothetical protein